MTKMRQFSFYAWPAAIWLVLLFLASGCAQLLGSLRQDLDDSPPYYEPTVGGTWPERSLLSGPPGDPYAAVGHSERRPASVDHMGRSRETWISPEQRDQMRRDQYRGQIGYSNNPNMVPAKRGNYSRRARKEDFVDSDPNEGSLWASSGQTNYFFTKNQVRSIGDILNLTVSKSLIENIATEVKKTLSNKEREMELQDAQTRLKREALGLNQPQQDQNGRAPAGGVQGPDAQAAQVAKVDEDDIEVRDATYKDIDVTPRLKLAEGDKMMAEIVERYKNGNYKIRATKRVSYRGERRMVNLVGIAKKGDISEEGVVDSGKLYEYRVSVFR